LREIYDNFAAGTAATTGRPALAQYVPGGMGNHYLGYWDVAMGGVTPPTQAKEMYKHHPMREGCPVGAGMLFTFIRHDGLVQMCACTADRRINLGNFLDLTPEQMIEKRFGHAICKQCLKYRNNLYYNLVDREKWLTPA
jgi:hypothetical protein